LDRSLQYLSFVQLALSPWAKQGRKCDAQALIKKSVKAPFFPIRISGEFSHKNIMRVFVPNKISVERKQSNMLACGHRLPIMNLAEH
jgi:hypothetical protein